MKHGENSGYQAGCREDCCLDAHFLWSKRWRLRRLAGEHTGPVPSDPSRRKVQALARLGWSLTSIADLMGVSRQALRQALQRDMILQSTERSIAEAYRTLEMKVPAETSSTCQTKKWAERNGWPPPLAWEDIETGELAPTDAALRKRAMRAERRSS